MEKLFLEVEFESFLVHIQGLKEKSAKSYISTLKNNIDLVPEFGIEEIKNAVIKNDKKFIANIRLPKRKKNRNMSARTFQNFRTHTNRYIQFLIYQIESNQTQSEDEEVEDEFLTNNLGDEIFEEEEYILDGDISEFDYDFIKKNFYFRLSSQNRFNKKSGFYFPISFLKQYFYKNKDKAYFDGIIENQMNGIQIRTENSKIPLSSISKLLLKDNCLYYRTKNNKNHMVHSYCTDKKMQKKFEITAFKDIHIDHIVSMNTILNELSKEDFSQLRMISKELDHKMHHPRTSKKLSRKSTSLANSSDLVEKLDKNKVKKEFEKICNKMELQLMHAKHNNFKRAKEI